MAHKTNNPPKACTGGGLCWSSGDSVEGADGPLTAKPETPPPSVSRMTIAVYAYARTAGVTAMRP